MLRNNGLIVHQSESPLFHLDAIIKPMHRNMKKAGFKEVITLQFPQPTYPSGWWTATMAIKNGDISAFREVEAISREFKTKYYNENIHKASRVMPTMMGDLS